MDGGRVVPQGGCRVHDEERVDHLVDLKACLEFACDLVGTAAQVSGPWGKIAAWIVGTLAICTGCCILAQQIMDRKAKIGLFDHIVLHGKGFLTLS